MFKQTYLEISIEYISSEELNTLENIKGELQQKGFERKRIMGGQRSFENIFGILPSTRIEFEGIVAESRIGLHPA